MGASACLPADGGLEDKIRSDREHVMGEDTEDNTVPNHRNFLKSKLLILIQVTNAITKFAIFFFLLGWSWFGSWRSAVCIEARMYQAGDR